jgi:hypothetical protein
MTVKAAKEKGGGPVRSRRPVAYSSPPLRASTILV